MFATRKVLGEHWYANFGYYANPKIPPDDNRLYSGGETKELALRMKVGQQLVFGEQIGWFKPDVIQDRERADYLKQVVRLRWQLRRYFYAGEMAPASKNPRQYPNRACRLAVERLGHHRRGRDRRMDAARRASLHHSVYQRERSARNGKTVVQCGCVWYVEQTGDGDDGHFGQAGRVVPVAVGRGSRVDIPTTVGDGLGTDTGWRIAASRGLARSSEVFRSVAPTYGRSTLKSSRSKGTFSRVAGFPQISETAGNPSTWRGLGVKRIAM